MKISELVSDIANFLQTTAREITYKKRLKVRTGRLRNSIIAIPGYTRGRVSFGVGVVYGRIQELGGEIKPKKAKHLWIPTRANMTQAGVMRHTPKDIFEKGFIRKNVFFLKDDNEIKPMFILKNKVEIKGKYFMKDAIQALNRNIRTLVERWTTKNKTFWKLPIRKKGGAI